MFSLTADLLPSSQILSVISLCKFLYSVFVPRFASCSALEMPLVADMNTDSNNEHQSTGENKAFSLSPRYLNLCCSQKHPGLCFPIANVPVSDEKAALCKIYILQL